MSKILAFSFFENLEQLLIYAVIIVVLIFLMILMSKNEFTKKLMIYIILVSVITSGVFSGIGLFKQLTKNSYINGTALDGLNTQTVEQFKYSTTSLTFYEDIKENKYIHTVNLPYVEDFNGEEKEYKVTLNSYYIINPVIKFRSVEADFTLNFYNTENEKIQGGILKIKIDFLSDKTTLLVSVENETLKQFYEKEFTTYGFNLKIEEIKGGTL